MKAAQFLTDWEVLALERAVQFAVEKGVINSAHGLPLLKQLEACSHVRLSYQPSKQRQKGYQVS